MHAIQAHPVRAVTDAEVEAFDRDGAVCLPGLLDTGWVDHLRAAVDRVLANPGPLAQRFDAGAAAGGFFGDKYMWTFDDGFRAFVMDSPVAGVAARLMGAGRVNFFFDHLLVKEPGTAEATPWHQDQPYWCVDGWQVCSIWVPLDPIPPETAVRYVAGSHRWGKWYEPKSFSGARDYSAGGDPVPDIDAAPDRHRVIGWPMEPGDVLAHHALTLHSAPGNASASLRRRALATRWTGDDARYAVRRCMPDIIHDPGLSPGDPMDSDLFPVVWRAPASAPGA